MGARNYDYLLMGQRPVPQGRARFRVFKKGKRYIVGKPYYSKTSTAYRNALLATFADAGVPPAPLTKVMVSIEAYGMRVNADPDNLAKQILDALVTAKVIVNDTCKVVRRLLVFCRARSDGKQATPAKSWLAVTVTDCKN